MPLLVLRDGLMAQNGWLFVDIPCTTTDIDKPVAKIMSNGISRVPGNMFGLGYSVLRGVSEIQECRHGTCRWGQCCQFGNVCMLGDMYCLAGKTGIS